MAIAERIRFFRNLRGMTQRYLGCHVGFAPKTADIRMAQYESGVRSPKEDLTKSLAKVLDVSPRALSVPDIDSQLGLMHTLFALEDLYGLRAEIKSKKVILHFEPTDLSDDTFFNMITDWAEQSTKFKSGKISKDEYDKWRYNYPIYDEKLILRKTITKDMIDSKYPYKGSKL